MEFASHTNVASVAMTDSHEARIMLGTDNPRRDLMAGLTTLRDPGTRNEMTFPIKRALEFGVTP